MAIYQFGNQVPVVDSTAYVADSAAVIGKVEMQAHSSVWFSATVRGDGDRIVLSENSNVQDGAVLHADPGFPLTLDRNVTVGPLAMLHGCPVGEGSLVGIKAVILNGAKIGRNCLVGAGALVTEGKEFPDNSLILGSPAKAVRTLSEEDVQRMHGAYKVYVERGQSYKQGLKRID